jgi:hypothetical protein
VYVARHFETASDAVVDACSGDWSWPSVNLPSVHRVDRFAGSTDDRRAANR